MARKLEEYPSVALKLEDLDGEIDFVRVFGRAGPVHIEIGTGKATFLLSQARTKPSINFLGIERANKYYRYAVDRIGRWGLTNVRIVHTDAAAFLANFIPDSSVDCFHIYFPDPWPKRRHHKRRFFCSTNLEHLIRCLKTGGQLRIATDHAEYFEKIQKLVTDQSTRPFGSAHACPSAGRLTAEQGRGGRLEEIEFLPAAGASNGQLTGTNYERKYLKNRRQIYTIALSLVIRRS